MGKELLTRSHYASNEIKEKLKELTGLRNTMLHRWEERWEHLQLILEVYQFARDAAVAEAWLIAQDPYLKSEELGVSFKLGCQNSLSNRKKIFNHVSVPIPLLTPVTRTAVKIFFIGTQNYAARNFGHFEKKSQVKTCFCQTNQICFLSLVNLALKSG